MADKLIKADEPAEMLKHLYDRRFGKSGANTIHYKIPGPGQQTRKDNREITQVLFYDLRGGLIGSEPTDSELVGLAYVAVSGTSFVWTRPGYENLRNEDCWSNRSCLEGIEI